MAFWGQIESKFDKFERWFLALKIGQFLDIQFCMTFIKDKQPKLDIEDIFLPTLGKNRWVDVKAVLRIAYSN